MPIVIIVGPALMHAWPLQQPADGVAMASHYSVQKYTVEHTAQSKTMFDFLKSTTSSVVQIAHTRLLAVQAPNAHDTNHHVYPSETVCAVRK